MNFDEIAKKHNEGLEYVYQGLNKYLTAQTSKSTLPFTHEEIVNRAEQLIVEFTNQNFIQQNLDLNSEGYEESIELISWGINKDWNDENETINHIKSCADLNPIVSILLIEIVSIEAKNYGQIVSSLKDIENRARKEIENEDDLNKVLGTITISSNSIKYWKDNQQKWEKMFKDAGYDINDPNLPCYISGYEADNQVATWILVDGVWITDNPFILGGCIGAIVGGSAGQWFDNIVHWTDWF